MKPPRYAVWVTPLLVAALANAQHTRKTEAQIDGLTGPVSSVSTSVDIHQPDVVQPDGPTIFEPIFCQECAYDTDGTRTRLGRMYKGQFTGELFTLEKDASGRITEESGHDANTGELESHRLKEPFGITEEDLYFGGKLGTRKIVRRDTEGNEISAQTFDDKGDLVREIESHWDSDGNLIEEKASHKDGSLEWLRTYDPAIDRTRFQHFDDSGTLTLDWTDRSGKLISFWKMPDSPRQLGDNFSDWDEHGDVTNFDCEGSRCNISHIHYEYLNNNKLNCQNSEWRDSDGNLKYAAYYEYQFDSHGNWTERKVWVVTPERSERTLYETDLRTITYWQ